MTEQDINRLLKNLEIRNIKGHFVQDLASARQLILEKISEECKVGIGNSRTLKAMQISEILQQRGNEVYDKTMAATRQETRQLKRLSLLTDWYLTGTNALSLEGHLVNMDHSGNRVAAMVYGPDKVIVVVGINKITPTLDDAIARVKNHAAPLNAKRAGYNPPCLTAGKCVDCKSDQRVCFNLLITEGQYLKDRMEVIIVNQELGF